MGTALFLGETVTTEAVDVSVDVSGALQAAIESKSLSLCPLWFPLEGSLGYPARVVELSTADAMIVSAEVQSDKYLFVETLRTSSGPSPARMGRFRLRGVEAPVAGLMIQGDGRMEKAQRAYRDWEKKNHPERYKPRFVSPWVWRAKQEREARKAEALATQARIRELSRQPGGADAPEVEIVLEDARG